MPVLFQYLIKLSCGLAVVVLFYQLVLRRLTFYNSNRWYLLAFSALCFVIPAINISGLIAQQQIGHAAVVQLIPAIGDYTAVQDIRLQHAAASSVSAWEVILFVLASGSLFLLGRFFIQFISYRQIRKGAQRLTKDRIAVYEVSKNIIPFSFGNAIYINPQLHTKAQLTEIIAHEFVHVKQRHTVDVLWAEIVCMLNWYNPAAWLLRHAVRQNLEFIADSQVLQSGVDKKEYQYLLLTVLGAPQFSMASPFNFSSLKKRIVMMNKLKLPKRTPSNFYWFFRWSLFY